MALLKSTNGSALQEIPIAALRKLRIDVPPLEEQHRIAQVLDCWSLAIDQVERLLKLKHRLKRGLMQQLLTGRRAFSQAIGQLAEGEQRPSDWPMVALAKIAQKLTRIRDNCRFR